MACVFMSADAAELSDSIKGYLKLYDSVAVLQIWKFAVAFVMKYAVSFLCASEYATFALDFGAGALSIDEADITASGFDSEAACVSSYDKMYGAVWYYYDAAPYYWGQTDQLAYTVA